MDPIPLSCRSLPPQRVNSSFSESRDRAIVGSSGKKKRTATLGRLSSNFRRVYVIRRGTPTTQPTPITFYSVQGILLLSPSTIESSKRSFDLISLGRFGLNSNRFLLAPQTHTWRLPFLCSESSDASPELWSTWARRSILIPHISFERSG